jgi:dipeptidyl aminopeptidase/acylaminoacyl peptidase
MSHRDHRAARLDWLWIWVGLWPASLALGVSALADEGKAPVTAADYAKWETLAPGALLSPDGKWLAYGITKGDDKYELRARALEPAADAKTEVFPFGGGAVFSDDSRWLAFAVGSADDEQVRNPRQPGRPGPPPMKTMGLFNLATREKSTIENVAAFAFSKGGGYLAIHRPAAGRPRPDATTTPGPAPAPPAEDKPAPGSDLLVRDLARGVVVSFGNVAAFAWQDKEGAHLLAMVVHAEGDLGRSVQLYDPASGVLRVLDSGGASYSGLAWRRDSDDLAAFRAKTVPDRQEPTQVVLAWRSVSDPKARLKTVDPTTAGFPADTRIVAARPLKWASTGEILFIGINSWAKNAPKPARSEKDVKTPKAKAGAGEAFLAIFKSLIDAVPKPADKDAKQAKDKRELSDVEVWHWKDVRLLPEQKLRAERDRRKNDLAAWWLADGKVVPLGRGWAEEVTPLEGGRCALAVDETPHDASRIFGRPYVDVFLIDTRTGERKTVFEGLAHLVGPSPGGRFVLYFRDGQYHAYDVKTDSVACLTGSLTSSFANIEDDHPTPERMPYPLGGWTKGDTTVLLHDRFDVWEIRPDGTHPCRLTRGQEEEVEHRVIRTEGPPARPAGAGEPPEAIDRAKPIYMAVYGEWTKKHGLAVIGGGGNRVERPVWLDRSVSRLIKAKSADTLAYVVQGFDDSPDIFVAGAALKDGRPVTETNPFQKDHAWGSAELVEYANSRGERLQGALYYPAGYQPGQTYPMVVYIYEKLSRNLHSYSAPSERSAYGPSVFTSRGYFYFMPDITFRPRDPGVSILDAVESGVRRVLDSGMVDRKRVGVMGHSWGGYGTAYLATRSDLFAAAVAGAPLTDLVSMYGSVFWNSGQAETSHYETGQERMEVPFWDDPESYRRNSPVTWIPRMKVPLLVAFGDKDGSVDWHQGIEMYNLARRANKALVLLVYPGENHSLAKKSNQVDYHRRILEWFDHYLRGAPAPAWIAKGVQHLDAEKARTVER